MYEPTNPRRDVHPSDYFYAPDEKGTPTDSDLDHLVVNDNALVVKYRPDASASDRQALEEWGPGVLALVIAPSSAKDAPAIDAYRRSGCCVSPPPGMRVFANLAGPNS